MFMENGYKVNDVFSMKLKDIMTLNEMLDSESSNGLTEDFLSLLM
ncbi:hypothetical protein [Vagococcus fluvialis]|nr:hypothetical protein [Vagococcus fluvialis]